MELYDISSNKIKASLEHVNSNEGQAIQEIYQNMENLNKNINSALKSNE